jgi:hypothetical protein
MPNMRMRPAHRAQSQLGRCDENRDHDREQRRNLPPEKDAAQNAKNSQRQPAQDDNKYCERAAHATSIGDPCLHLDVSRSGAIAAL